MRADRERVWIVTASLIITGFLLAFSATAPLLGYPLTYEQVPRVAEIITPVLFGYLGTATHSLFREKKQKQAFAANMSRRLALLLVRGPVFIFGAVALLAFTAFGWSNRLAAPRGIGMTVDQLTGTLAGSLALLTATTNIVVSHLFTANDAKDNSKQSR